MSQSRSPCAAHRRESSCTTFCSIVALLGLFAFPLSAFAQDLALKRVMLSSGGLGYFEYEATVDGDATLRLTVSLEQVDDVLKSLVVYDDKGGVGGLSLPGREPLAQAFKDLPFDQELARLAGRSAGDAEGRAGDGGRRARHHRPHRLGAGGDGGAAMTARPRPSARASPC